MSDFLSGALAWTFIVVSLVGFQLHTYLAEPTDLDEDLDDEM